MSDRINFGYVPGPLAGKAHTVEGLCDVSDLGPNDGAGQVVCLYKYLAELLGGPVVPRDQGQSPTCVANATAGAVDRLQALLAIAFGKQFQFLPADPNSIYALARYEVGYKIHGRRPSGDGTYPSLAAEAIRDFGCLAMQAYPQIDLTKFDDELYQLWGSTGLPDELEPTAKLSVIKRYIPVRSYEEVRAAIANGMPVIYGGTYGFKGGVRDKDGFMRPRGTWNHSMLWDAVDDAFSRPGVHNQNSWAETPSGPKRNDQPEGGFWIDAEVIDDMAKECEAIAVCGFSTFDKIGTSLNYRLI